MRIWIAAALAVMSSTPALAGKAKELDCVLVMPNVAESLGQAVIAKIETNKTVRPETEEWAVSAMAENCTQKLGWTKAEEDAAIIYTMWNVSLPTFEAGLQRNGIDPKKATRVFKAMSPETRASFADGKRDDMAMRAYLNAQAQALHLKLDERKVVYLGMLATYLSNIEKYKAEFLTY